jgi:hypothetical protein
MTFGDEVAGLTVGVGVAGLTVGAEVAPLTVGPEPESVGGGIGPESVGGGIGPGEEVAETIYLANVRPDDFEAIRSAIQRLAGSGGGWYDSIVVPAHAEVRRAPPADGYEERFGEVSLLQAIQDAAGG